MISAKIIADSLNPQGYRLTTMQLRYPRFIHGGFMTHRVFSRNASSSRAVPTRRLLSDILKDMAEPVSWGQNNPGMQSKSPLTGWRRQLARGVWRVSGYVAVGFAYLMHKIGAHKQIVNRIVEPWSHISVVVSSTEWENFFALRDHKDADPTIRVLAQEMRKALETSGPNRLNNNEWHLPYVSQEEREIYNIDDLQVMSAARCARVSYLTHEGKSPSFTDDQRLYKQLVKSSPVHASPLEHQAVPEGASDYFCGNFQGWSQHRKLIGE